MFRKEENHDIAFEEALGEEWSRDLDVVEVPLGNRPLVYLGMAIFTVAFIFISRVVYLNIFRGNFYLSRATNNAINEESTPAPRGLIYARDGSILGENIASFSSVLNTKIFLHRGDIQEETLRAIENVLYVPRDEVWGMIQINSAEEFSTPLVLNDNLNGNQIIQLTALNLPTILVKKDFKRLYRESGVFSSVLGYVGRVSGEDLSKDSSLHPEDFIGKSGIESFYDSSLRGKPGIVARNRDARGKILSEEIRSEAKIGNPLKLAIDKDFQRYFYERMEAGLAYLGRRAGAGIAINPENGEVLAMASFPGFDNSILSASGNNDAKREILFSPDKPLFNRAVAGFYTPGSTIKPLVGIAALKDGVIDQKREIFSPGYLDVPNPYDPSSPTRYLDWRYQGNVNLASAIAKSSNVYFYTVGGGADGIKGLGINKLNDWWQKFLLGKSTGIDLPGEGSGFLPSPGWREQKTGKPWLLGDTYNVSIGQGDLLVTPIQLLNYISAVANGGKIYKPVLNLDAPHPQILADLSYLLPQIKEVQKGMREAVTSPLGTAYLLHDLGFPVGAKTGTSQIKSNQEENAFFVGYAPYDNPKIAILILIENSLEGSLNTVPIAKDVLNWYYWNKLRGK